MEIKVFEITENIIEEKLEDIDIQNINKIFKKIFAPKNTEHLNIDCSADYNSILIEYHKESKTFDMSRFAEKLRMSELKSDGSRNKQITEGNLFIKKEKNQLILLKLENIEVVDKEKNYEMKKSFSTESNYYKGCILRDDLNNITVIDKNKSVAKYWRERFLNLCLNRNEYQNSKELIDLLKDDKLFSKDIKEGSNFKEIKTQIENHIFKSDTFDKQEVAKSLRSKGLISQMNLSEIYSDESKYLDSEFLISKKAIKEEYKKTIYVSKDTKIHTENYVKLFRRQGIEYRDGKIILTVDDNLINDLPGELKNGNNR